MQFYKKKLFNVISLLIILGLFGSSFINGFVVNNPVIENTQNNTKHEENIPKLGIHSEIHHQKNDQKALRPENSSQTQVKNLQPVMNQKIEIKKENVSKEEHAINLNHTNEIKREIIDIKSKDKKSAGIAKEMETEKIKELSEGEIKKENVITLVNAKSKDSGIKNLKTKGRERSAPNINLEKLKLEDEINKSENVVNLDKVKSNNSNEKSAENIIKIKATSANEENNSSSIINTVNMKLENISKTQENSIVVEKPLKSIAATKENITTINLAKPTENIVSTKDSPKVNEIIKSNIKEEIPKSKIDLNNKNTNTTTVNSISKAIEKPDKVPTVTVANTQNIKPQIIESSKTTDVVTVLPLTVQANIKPKIIEIKKPDPSLSENSKNKVSNDNHNSTSLNIPKQNFIIEAKTYFDNFLIHPVDSTYNLTALVIKPFSNVYSTLSKPNERAEKNFFSQHVIPLFKVFCFFLSIISIFAFTIYSSMVAGKMLANKFFPKTDTEGNKSTFFKKNLNLKGRTKKNPNNINYNDLFKDNEEKHQINKKGKISNDMNNDIDDDIEDRHCKNLDDFLERVNEKKEFQKFFNDGSTNMNGDAKFSRNFNQNVDDNKQISIVLKNNEENLILFDDHTKKNSRKPTEVKFVQKEMEKEILFDQIKYHEMEDNNFENSLEIRKKNPSLFHKTPLANIRKNTMSSQK